MIKNITRLEYKIGERIYHLLCDMDCSTVEIKEVCSQILAHMVQIEKHASELRAAQEESAKDVEVEAVD